MLVARLSYPLCDATVYSPLHEQWIDPFTTIVDGDVPFDRDFTGLGSNLNDSSVCPE